MAASKIANEEKLHRLLFTARSFDKNCVYLTGLKRIGLVSLNVQKAIHTNLIQQSKEGEENVDLMLKLIEKYNEDGHLPRRYNLFYLLANLSVCDVMPPSKKPLVGQTLLNVLKDEEDLFFFMYVSTDILRRQPKSKISKTIQKTIQKWYNSKSGQELAKIYGRHSGLYSWTHKDLIKYAHVKSDTPEKAAVIKYILFGKLDESPEDTPEVKEVQQILKKIQTVRKTTDPAVAIPIINELKLNHNQINNQLHTSQEIWSAVLPQLSVQDILKLLPKLYKLGHLKASTPTQSKIVEVLTSPEQIKAHQIHPIEVFIHMKNYEKGGRPMDGRLVSHLKNEKKISDEELEKIRSRNVPKCPVIKNCISKCLSLSYSNVSSTGKRYLITIEVPATDMYCISNKNILGLEAALAYTLTVMKTEKDVTVAVYKENEIQLINLEKGGQFHENLNKLREQKSGDFSPAASIDWANNKKKHFDVFFNFMTHSHDFQKMDKLAKVVESVYRYKKKVNLQNVKVVSFSLSSMTSTVADGTPNVLDVIGFDATIPKLVSAFIKGEFS